MLELFGIIGDHFLAGSFGCFRPCSRSSVTHWQRRLVGLGGPCLEVSTRHTGLIISGAYLVTLPSH